MGAKLVLVLNKRSQFFAQNKYIYIIFMNIVSRLFLFAL